MPTLDGLYTPFSDYPGYSSMAPCMRSCENSQSYNGCDQARCWCNKGNLDLRVASVTRCASSKCTFANMNTQTDVDVISNFQIMYCADKGLSPEGMTMPSTVQAKPTATGGIYNTRTITGLPSRAYPTSGPSATLGTSTNTNNNSIPSVLNTTTKIGIGVGSAFCLAVIFAMIYLCVRRRRRQPQYYPPPPPYQNTIPPPIPTAPTPYTVNSPFSPPLQPAPIHIPQQPQQYASYTKGDVSPIEEKAVPAVSINRKEVGNSRTDLGISSPTPPPATTKSPPPTVAQHNHHGPAEIYGDIPAPRHEIPIDGEITNTVSTRGMELDGTARPVLHQYPQGSELAGSPMNQYPRGSELDGSTPNHYQQSGQGQWGYGYPQAQELSATQHQQQQQQRQELPGSQNEWRQELAGGQNQWQQRQELAGGQTQWQQRHELGGGGTGAHEMGPGR
ncbi:hypothetical protein B0J11DRAFT_334363 [Dendryphion nanum]|uniref:Extracellular membrane protein CFEM domain-containing protein n=1 Tax=Dendryphion nanum TaxID=256645 RepID=A0A9P9DMU2_9PLEO|nr:hypothetical protein B0J11DRAFT_334363 [Dendryphion nanum]